MTDVAFLPDGSRVVSSSKDRTVRLWDPVTGDNVVALHGHPGVVRSLAVSRRGDFIASCGRDRTVRIWRGPAEIER